MFRRLGALAVLLLLTACSEPSSPAAPEPSVAVGLGERPSPAATRDVESMQFSMPSGNVGCYLDESSARCDIAAKTWKPPAKPSDCGQSWGNSVSVSRADASMVCAGDTVMGAKDILAYGQAVRAGDLVCESASAGVRCFHDATGHGFTLSREKYTLF